MTDIRKILLIAACCVCYGIASAQTPPPSQHGSIQQLRMPCKLLQGVMERDYSIYLPPSYSATSQRRLPVLYLLHGGGESHTVWQRNGRLSQVADSLISCGAMKEMIIVCPEANQNNMIYFNAPHWKYEDYFFKELIPFIEKTYNTRSDKKGRAIAGFSMGGGAATVYGVHHPEKFVMVYEISGYQRRQEMEWLRNDPSATWRQQLIEDCNPIRRIEQGTEADVQAWRQVDWYVRVGDQDFTLEANMDLVKAFRTKKIPYGMYVSSGSHDWRFVAPAMTDALKRSSRHF